METFFRKYFWTAHFIFIFLVALIAAKTINLFVESLILPPPKEDPPRVRRTVAQPVPQLQLDRLATLTGLPVPKEPEVQEPDQPPLDPNAPPVKCGLRVKLLGVLAASI